MSIILDGTTGITTPDVDSTADISVNGITVGKGAGAVSTNTAVGASALAANTSGVQQTVVGASAGASITTNAYLSAVGYQAAYYMTDSNDAFGRQALYGQSGATGYYNVGVGFRSGYSMTSGNLNTAIGNQALYSNTTASDNTAVGYRAGYSNTTGTQNVAIGTNALDANTTAAGNTAVGYDAGGAITTGAYNTCIGVDAGESITTAGDNTMIGRFAGNQTTGSDNTFLGKNSGYLVTTGSANTILGQYTGNNGGLDIRTASNYIVLSDGDGNPRAWIGAGNNNDLFRVGTTSTATPDWMHQISYSQTSRFALGVTNDVSGGNPSGISIRYPNSGDTSGTNFFLYCYSTAGQRFGVKNDGGINNFSANNTNLSDRREKTNFAPAKSYLDTICSIPVQTFNYVDQDMEEDPGLTLGVVAQDVQEVAPELVTESNWGTKEEPKMRLSIYQTDLQYALMKCIQELKSELDTVKAEFDAYKEAHP